MGHWLMIGDKKYRITKLTDEPNGFTYMAEYFVFVYLSTAVFLGD
jgi:hypothetical protein